MFLNIKLQGINKVINMDVNYIKKHYTFETLDSNHYLDDFECESKELTDFLKKDALKQQKMNLSVTQLVICDGVIIGYVSILSDKLKIKILNDENTRNTIREELNVSENNTVPAVKIGRFAIDKRYSKKGLGTHILANILLSLLKLSKTKLGFRFVTVDAYAYALNFYLKNNFFIRSTDKNLFKKIEKIKKQDPNRCFNIYFDLKK